jgi:serine/threonine-protein kinase
LPADRFANAAQFADALDGRGPTLGTRASSGAGSRMNAADVGRSTGGTRWHRRVEIAAGLVLGASIVAVGAWFHARGAGAQPVERRYVALGDNAQVVSNQAVGSAFALSPNGSVLAFVGDTLGRIWIKRREILDPAPIAGTEHASDPEFSPDGEWIGYIADGQLRKIRVDGGPSTTLADSAAGGYGVAWLDDGTLVYTAMSQLGLRRVAATGGAVSIVLADSVLHGDGALFATALPRSRGVLFEDCTSNCVTASLHVLDLKTGKQKKLIDGVRTGWYLPNGELLYLGRDGVANAVPFDLDRLAISGASIPVLQGVSVPGDRAMLAWSASGKVVYEVANARADAWTLRYANRAGAMTDADPRWTGDFNSFAISPDGHRAAVSVTTQGAGIDIWIKQLDTGPFTRLTFSGHDRRPTWSPDGRQVAFVRDNASGSGADVYARAADGAGTDRRLAHLDRTIQEVTWSHDGRWLLVRTDNSQAGNGDIVALGTLGASAPVPVATSRFTELEPALSPDERWVAYVSNDAGRNEVYVSPFPAGGGSHWQISNGGGGSPAWSPDGKQLYFLDAANRLIAAQLAVEPTFHVTALTPLFDAPRFNYVAYHQAFAVMPDGRFAFIDQLGQSTTNAVRLVQIDNWFADLKAKLKQ